MKNMIVQNLVAALKEPSIYIDQNLHQQFPDFIMESYEIEQNLLELIKDWQKN